MPEASKRGARSWLNAMPLMRYQSDLGKSKFRDCIDLRYDWDPVKMPSLFAFSENFNVAPALHCQKERYKDMRYDELRDSIANFLSVVCHNIEIKLHVQQLQGETFALK